MQERNVYLDCSALLVGRLDQPRLVVEKMHALTTDWLRVVGAIAQAAEKIN